MPTNTEIRTRIKELIVESLNLEGMEPTEIGDEQPLFGEGEGLELDSVDALEMLVALEQEYGVRIEGQEIDPEAFATVAKLAEMVEELERDAG